MEQQRKKTLGWLGLLLGGSGVGYAGWKLGWFKGIVPPSAANYVQVMEVSFQPGATSPYPLGVSVATVTWQNPSSAAVAYGVQAYIVSGGVVNGHWWTSLAAAESAMQASRSGGSAALAPYVANVVDRVAVVTVQAGQQGTARLYEQLALPESETWIFLVHPLYTGGLVATDPQGANASSIAQAGDSGVSVQVTVG